VIELPSSGGPVLPRKDISVPAKDGPAKPAAVLSDSLRSHARLLRPAACAETLVFAKNLTVRMPVRPPFMKADIDRQPKPKIVEYLQSCDRSVRLYGHAPVFADGAVDRMAYHLWVDAALLRERRAVPLPNAGDAKLAVTKDVSTGQAIYLLTGLTKNPQERVELKLNGHPRGVQSLHVHASGDPEAVLAKAFRAGLNPKAFGPLSLVPAPADADARIAGIRKHGPATSGFVANEWPDQGQSPIVEEVFGDDLRAWAQELWGEASSNHREGGNIAGARSPLREVVGRSQENHPQWRGEQRTAVDAPLMCNADLYIETVPPTVASGNADWRFVITGFSSDAAEKIEVRLHGDSPAVRSIAIQSKRTPAEVLEQAICAGLINGKAIGSDFASIPMVAEPADSMRPPMSYRRAFGPAAVETASWLLVSKTGKTQPTTLSLPASVGGGLLTRTELPGGRQSVAISGLASTGPAHKVQLVMRGQNVEGVFGSVVGLRAAIRLGVLTPRVGGG